MIINQNILFKDILKSAKLFYQKLPQLLLAAEAEKSSDVS